MTKRLLFIALAGLVLALAGCTADPHADRIAAVNDDVATAMFVMLHHFPVAEVLSLVAVVLVVVFFVTSSDSGILMSRASTA